MCLLHTAQTLLFLLLTSTSTLTAPAGPQAIPQDTSIINQQAPLGAALNCFQRPKGFSPPSPPKFQSCAVALRYLPPEDVDGKFHTEGVYDNYRLPVTKSSGGCSIQIEAAKEGETANWVQIGLAATQLAMACSTIGDSGSSSGFGGATYAGLTNGIMIQVLPKVNGVGAEVNATALMATS